MARNGLCGSFESARVVFARWKQGKIRVRKKLFDPLRRLEVAASPEERVRQQLVDWLQREANVPGRLIAVEYALSRLVPGCRKRADVVVWRPGMASGGAGETPGGLEPWLLAECKAPGVKLTEAVADQVRGYAATVRAAHVLITNGAETLVYRAGPERYEPCPALPRYAPPPG